MSRTHSIRHKWKNKQRKKTGNSDPQKIKLHRKRILNRIYKEKEEISVPFAFTAKQAARKAFDFIKEEYLIPKNLIGLLEQLDFSDNEKYWFVILSFSKDNEIENKQYYKIKLTTDKGKILNHRTYKF